MDTKPGPTETNTKEAGPKVRCARANSPKPTEQSPRAFGKTTNCSQTTAELLKGISYFIQFDQIIRSEH